MNRMEHAEKKALVKALLEESAKARSTPAALDWSLQGMGMLRLKLSPTMRLHVWDSRYRWPGVSMVHDHLQWHLHSTIIAGRLNNIRYVESPDGVLFKYRTLRAGYGCTFVDDGPSEIRLLSGDVEEYTEGANYTQCAAEIHETDAVDGTVTIMTQRRTESDQARVFWPADREWGTAEPRPATIDEIRAITGHALERWFA